MTDYGVFILDSAPGCEPHIEQAGSLNRAKTRCDYWLSIGKTRSSYGIGAVIVYKGDDGVWHPWGEDGDEFTALLNASSLGTMDARAYRSMTSDETVAEIMRRAGLGVQQPCPP